MWPYVNELRNGNTLVSHLSTSPFYHSLHHALISLFSAPATHAHLNWVQIQSCLFLTGWLWASHITSLNHSTCEMEIMFVYSSTRSCPLIFPFFFCLFPLFFGPFIVHVLWSLVFYGCSLKGGELWCPSHCWLRLPPVCRERLHKLGTLSNKLHEIF